eukprot:COSAG01_NODE_4245_length_5210_cov_1.702074_3_plen_176_part_00
MTFPAKRNQVGFTNMSWGGNHSFHQTANSVSSNHSERLEVGYRWYDSHASEPAYPFGHGLPGYSSFRFSGLQASTTSVNFTLQNIGSVAATETPQLYVSFPRAAGEPPWQLKGFEKVFLGGGHQAVVSMRLKPRDFSVWSVESHSWTLVKGTFGVAVGSSSRDHRLEGAIVVPAD